MPHRRSQHSKEDFFTSLSDFFVSDRVETGNVILDHGRGEFSYWKKTIQLALLLV